MIGIRASFVIDAPERVPLSQLTQYAKSRDGRGGRLAAAARPPI